MRTYFRVAEEHLYDEHGELLGYVYRWKRPCPRGKREKERWYWQTMHEPSVAQQAKDQDAAERALCQALHVPMPTSRVKERTMRRRPSVGRAKGDD